MAGARFAAGEVLAEALNLCAVRLRRVATLAALVAAFVSVPPALVGIYIRAQLEPWLAQPLTWARAGTLQSELAGAGWFTTRVALTLASARMSGAGELHLEHSPITWTTGSAGWPGYMHGTGHLTLEGAIPGGLYTPSSNTTTLGVDIAAGAPGHATATLQIPAGTVRVEGADISVQRATLTMAMDLLDQQAPMPFVIRIETPDGALDATGELDPATGHWQLLADVDTTLAMKISAALLTAELRTDPDSEPDPEIVNALASRRLRSLITLGLLRERGGRLVTKASFDGTDINVFGARLTFALPSAASVDLGQ